MKEIKISDQPKLLNELVESIGQATGACSQLLHLQQQPAWMVIRDTLELAKEGVIGIATFETRKITAIKPN